MVRMPERRPVGLTAFWAVVLAIGLAATTNKLGVEAHAGHDHTHRELLSPGR